MMEKSVGSILYLCKRETYLHKMSRVRFHSVKAIEKLCSVVWSGPGWENWDDSKDLKGNIKQLYQGKNPDLILCYKPYEIPGFSEVNIPKCVRYNEMNTPQHPIEYTVKEITENKVDIVIAHHKNEMYYPEFQGLPCKIINFSHCAEKTIFKDYNLAKSVDILLVGNLHPERYPLRARLHKLLLKMKSDPKYQEYNIGIYPHPGYQVEHANNDAAAIAFAKAVNGAKICLTCSGAYHSRYAKYAEIPACRSLLMADLPDEDHTFFEQFVAVIRREDSDEAIIERMVYYLQNDEERQRLTDIGYQLTHENYTQENYAQWFLKALF